MEQGKEQTEYNPWYLDAEGNPLPMDQMMSALYPDSRRGAWVSQSPSGRETDDWEEREREPYVRELETWKKRYPQKIQILERYVEHACDTLDYEGSVIYDEQPDAWAMDHLCHTIGSQIMEDLDAGQMQSIEAEDLPAWEDGEEGYFQVQNETALRSVSCPGCGSGKWPPERPPRPYPPGRPPRPYPPGWRPPKPYPPGPPPRPYPSSPDHSWIQDILPVLLFQEIYKRRCHHRNCQKQYG